MISIAIYETSSEGRLIIRDYLAKNGYVVYFIGEYEVKNGLLRNFDAVIFPGGSQHLFQYVADIHGEFRDEILKYVSDGGNFIGICGGALLGGWLHLGDCKMGFLRLFPYYLYYTLFKKRGKVHIYWSAGNSLDMHGSQDMTWVAGPCIKDFGSLRVEAYYAGNKFLFPWYGQGAIASGNHGKGKVFLFGPHPEYPCDGADNLPLLLKAIKLMLGG